MAFYNQTNQPFVAKGNPLTSWPCVHWSLQDWANKCDKIQFVFRVHKRNHTNEMEWENKALDYVTASVRQLVDHVQAPNNASSSNNPFCKYPSDQYSFYSAYNYMTKVFGQPDQSEIMQSIRWRDTGIDDAQLVNDGSNSTIWIGTSGAYTPCHLDTYGYNFVAQLHGKKLWILFPPEDTNNLYPTRIPYEESSIFSEVNLNSKDSLRKYPRLANTKPRIVELQAGEILFVPHHWWHYVENCDSAPNNSDISISINTWITGDQYEDSLNECLVHFLARPLFDSYGDQNWININADLFSAGEAMKTLVCLLNDRQEFQTNSSNNDQIDNQSKLQIEYLKEFTFKDIAELKNIDHNIEDNLRNETNQIKHRTDIRDIVNSILHPEVIELIKSKLQQRYM